MDTLTAAKFVTSALNYNLTDGALSNANSLPSFAQDSIDPFQSSEFSSLAYSGYFYPVRLWLAFAKSLRFAFRKKHTLSFASEHCILQNPILFRILQQLK